MRKVLFNINSRGFSLLEALLSVTLFIMIATSFVSMLIYGQEGASLGGNNVSAVFLAEEGLEAVRNMRDSDFANLIDGTHGLLLSGNEWVFSGVSDVTDIFTREIIISTIDSNRKEVTCNVTWQQNEQRTGEVLLVTRLNNWGVVTDTSDFIIDISGAALNSNNLTGITISNNGSADLTVESITVTWDNSQLIERVIIDGADVWLFNGVGTPDGRQPSGTELDIQDFLLPAGSGPFLIDFFSFNGDMSGSIFTIDFHLDDMTIHQAVLDFSGFSCGDQANSFVIDSSGASIGGNGNRDLLGVTIENTDNLCPVTIDMVTVWWSNPDRLIQQIRVDGTNIWVHNDAGTPDGRQPSGTELNNEDFILNGDDGILNINRFRFNGNMTNNNFDILFTFTDATSKSEEVNFGETIPPSDITDLVASNPSATSVYLTWTAPGDDGTSGTASLYDVRYSTSTITEANWDTATQVDNEPVPQIAGSSEFMAVFDLDLDTEYFFAVKTYDDMMNGSGISNVSSVRTLASATEADYLSVDVSGAVLASRRRELAGITMENTGPDNITIDTVTVTWTNTRQIEIVEMNNTDVWVQNGVGTPDGRQPSGTELDIVDHTIPIAATHPIDRFRFNGRMTGNTFTITFLMGDGSSKLITGIQP